MDDLATALANCDREPVHSPGRIQGFGTLIGFDPESGCLNYVASNLTELIPGVTGALGTRADQVLPGDFMHLVRNGLALPGIGKHRERIGTSELGATRVDLAVFRSGVTAVVEIEPVGHETSVPSIARIRSMLASLDTGGSIVALADSAVDALHVLTGYDRVMCYRFLPDGEGEVIAEARGPDIEPYLGLRYPASDIPAPVRQIMLNTPFRIIHDIDAPHADLISLSGAPELDLTLSQLRGVSPIHIEYLRNMGVSATSNVTIVVHASLWGLFAFHHYSARKLSPDHRSICEIFGHLVSLQIQEQLERESLSHRRRANSILASIREGSGKDVHEEFLRAGTGLLEAVNADGAALLLGGHTEVIGEAPAPDVLDAIAGLANEGIVAIDSLVAANIDLSREPARTAGALVLSLSAGDPSAHLVFTRNEVITEVRWAGRPEKNIADGPHGPRLMPRTSFEEYRESVAGKCAPWSRANIEAASEIRRTFHEMVYRESRGTDALLLRQKAQQDLLIAELQHRVKNVLALVQSIARQTMASSTSLENYVVSFQQRIEALAHAHDLVGASTLQWPRLDRLVRAELAPYGSAAARIVINGPALAIRTDIAPVLALVLHEAATNAAKHGALSETGKSLEVTWSEDAGGVSLTWQERLESLLPPPKRRGFGLSLLEQAIPHECGGEARVTLEATGMRMELWLPAAAVRRATVVETTPDPDPIAAPATVATGPRALVIEDNAVLATELGTMLRALGASTVASGATTAFGREQLASKSFDFAVLDADLKTEMSFELAREILATGIPVVMLSGYESRQFVPEDLANLPWLTKPVNQMDLSRVLKIASSDR